MDFIWGQEYSPSSSSKVQKEHRKNKSITKPKVSTVSICSSPNVGGPLLIEPNSFLDKLREPNPNPLFGGNRMEGRNPREPFSGHLSSELNTYIDQVVSNKNHFPLSHRFITRSRPVS